MRRLPAKLHNRLTSFTLRLTAPRELTSVARHQRVPDGGSESHWQALPLASASKSQWRTLREVYFAGSRSPAQPGAAALHQLGSRAPERRGARSASSSPSPSSASSSRFSPRRNAPTKSRSSTRSNCSRSALSNYGERVLREVDSVASSARRDPQHPPQVRSDWAKQRAGLGCRPSSTTTTSSSSTARTSRSTRARPPAADRAWFERARARPDRAARLHARPLSDACRDAIRLSQATLADARRAPQAAVIRRSARPAGDHRRRRGRPGSKASPPPTTFDAPILMSVKFIDDDVLAGIATPTAADQPAHDRQRAGAARRLRLRIERAEWRRTSPASPGRRSSRAPRSCTASCPSSPSRSPASRCSPPSCCATCAAPPRPSPPAKRGCAISPCTIRCAACPTASSSASGSRR